MDDTTIPNKHSPTHQKDFAILPPYTKLVFDCISTFPSPVSPSVASITPWESLEIP